MKANWLMSLGWVFSQLIPLISSDEQTPLGYLCERHSQCLSGCCDVSECKVKSKCDKIFGVWTIIGIIVLLIIVILATIWIVAACCGYCTCILCCLKEKFRKRREKNREAQGSQTSQTTDLPLSDPTVSFMDPEEEEKYVLEKALRKPNRQPPYVPPDRLAQLSQFTIESVAIGNQNSKNQENPKKKENASIELAL